MSASKCFFYTLCAVIIFLGASGLIIPPSSFGKNSPLPEQQEEDDSLLPDKSCRIPSRTLEP